jgi:hypothetical protein
MICFCEMDCVFGPFPTVGFQIIKTRSPVKIYRALKARQAIYAHNNMPRIVQNANLIICWIRDPQHHGERLTFFALGWASEHRRLHKWNRGKRLSSRRDDFQLRRRMGKV